MPVRITGYGSLANRRVALDRLDSNGSNQRRIRARLVRLRQDARPCRSHLFFGALDMKNFSVPSDEAVHRAFALLEAVRQAVAKVAEHTQGWDKRNRDSVYDDIDTIAKYSRADAYQIDRTIAHLKAEVA